MAKRSVDIKRITFYLWVGLAFLLLNLLGDLISAPETFLKRSMNQSWLILYTLGTNYVLFVYTVPYILKRKYILSKILLSLFSFFVLMMVCSFGIYAWRCLGVGLHTYNALKTFKSV